MILGSRESHPMDISKAYSWIVCIVFRLPLKRNARHVAIALNGFASPLSLRLQDLPKVLDTSRGVYHFPWYITRGISLPSRHHEGHITSPPNTFFKELKCNQLFKKLYENFANDLHIIVWMIAKLWEHLQQYTLSVTLDLSKQCLTN